MSERKRPNRPKETNKIKIRVDHHVLCINGEKTAHEIYLKVLVVVRIEAKTGDEAVHHEFYVGVLAAGPPPEGFRWVEQQCLVGRKGKPLGHTWEASCGQTSSLTVSLSSLGREVMSQKL